MNLGKSGRNGYIRGGGKKLRGTRGDGEHLKTGKLGLLFKRWERGTGTPYVFVTLQESRS